MPAAWSAGADLHLSGGEYQLTTETRGADAFWTITPERPIWGSQRFVLRSSRSLKSERDIDPPGDHSAGKRSGRCLSGRRQRDGPPADDRELCWSRKDTVCVTIRAREFTSGGHVGRCISGDQESWALRVQLPRDAAETSDSEEGSARVAFAEMIVRSCRIGRASAGPCTRRRQWFALVVRASRRQLAALGDGRLQSRHSAPLVIRDMVDPLDDHRQSRIGLIWKTERPRTTPRSTWPVVLPRAGSGPATTLVSVYTPSRDAIRGDGAGLEPVTMAELEMARADWLARCIGDLVAKIDRSSGRDHEKLVSLLINHEMALRSARERPRRLIQGRPRLHNRSAQDFDPFRLARSARMETIRRAGLEEISRPPGVIWVKPPSISPGPLSASPNRPSRIASVSWGGRSH